MRIYYLDESGSTGDLIKGSRALDFRQEPVFSLACVGVDDMADLEDEIKRLKSRYKVQSVELKSMAIKGKPLLVAELAAYLARRRLPVFIEVVDKRFLFCATMVNHLILPPVGQSDTEPQSMWIKNVFAEYLHANLPDSIMQTYADACGDCSIKSTRRAFDTLLLWLSGGQPDTEVAEALYRFTAESQEDFEALAGSETDAWRVGLPIPDQSKRGNPFWMLPNLSSFTNIYARINRLHQRDVSGLRLVHDEQAQYDQILASGKIATEGLIGNGINLPFAYSDYSFTQQADLAFERSIDCVGIQVADVLAGFVMRYVQDGLRSEPPPHSAHSKAMQAIIELSDPPRGIGINFMLTNSDIRRLGVHATPDF